MSKLTLDNENQVFFYEQDFYVLSNFSAFNVEIYGRDFQTSEHAYHFMKFRDTDKGVAHMVQNARSAHNAFKIAEKFKNKRRVDWDNVKVDIMRDILMAKVAQHEYVRRKLIDTGDRELIENSWRDSFWGWGEDRKGQNQLGKLWMEIRELVKEVRKMVQKGMDKDEYMTIIKDLVNDNRGKAEESQIP